MLRPSSTFKVTVMVLPAAVWQPLQLAKVSFRAASNDF